MTKLFIDQLSGTRTDTIRLPELLESAKITVDRSKFLTSKLTIEQGHLPQDFSAYDLVVCVPAYKRYFSESNEFLGALPSLLSDIFAAAQNENKTIAVIVSDDTPINDFKADLPNALRTALSDYNNVNLFVFGKDHQKALHTLTFEAISSQLEIRLAAENKLDDLSFHLKTIQMLMTEGGYGPQRVRLQALTFLGKSIIASRDSDLRLFPIKPVEYGTNDSPGHAFMFVPQDQINEVGLELDENVKFLTPALSSSIGKNATRIHESVTVGKDLALTNVLTTGQLSEFSVAPNGQAAVQSDFDGPVIRACFSHKWGIPDINGFVGLKALIITGQEGLSTYAFPLQSSTEEIIVKSTPNPDCAVETARHDDLLSTIPWLVTLGPQLLGEGGRIIKTGARAEDQLRCNLNNPQVAFSYTPDYAFHARESDGRAEDHVVTFLSEDLGDLVAAIVRKGLRFAENTESWEFNSEGIIKEHNGSIVFDNEFFDESIRPQVDKIWNRIQEIGSLISSTKAQDQAHQKIMTGIIKELEERCGTDKGTFTHRINEYLKQQIEFVSSVMYCYPILLQTVADIRQKQQLAVLKVFKED